MLVVCLDLHSFHRALNSLLFGPIRLLLCTVDAMTGRRSIQQPWNLSFLVLNRPNHRLTMQTQRQQRNPTPATIIKASCLFFLLLIPTFPVNYSSIEYGKMCSSAVCDHVHFKHFQVSDCGSYKKLEVVAFEDSCLWRLKNNK